MDPQIIYCNNLYIYIYVCIFIYICTHTCTCIYSLLVEFCITNLVFGHFRLNGAFFSHNMEIISFLKARIKIKLYIFFFYFTIMQQTMNYFYYKFNRIF